MIDRYPFLLLIETNFNMQEYWHIYNMCAFYLLLKPKPVQWQKKVSEFIHAVLFSLQSLCSVAPVSFCQLDWVTQCRPCWRTSLQCQAVQAGAQSVSHRRSTLSTWEVMKQKKHATLCQRWVNVNILQRKVCRWVCCIRMFFMVLLCLFSKFINWTLKNSYIVSL